MQKISNEIRCPFCQGQIDDLSRQQIMLLRSTIMSDIVPALIHDARHSLSLLHLTGHIVKRELAGSPSGGKRLKEALRRNEEALREIHQFFDTLRSLYRMPEHDVVIPLRELPERIRWMLDVFGLRERPDVESLKASHQDMRFAPFWDTFTLALHVALISLRQDRRPVLTMGFNVRDNRLVTAIRMGHQNPVDTDTPLWVALESTVNNAGGDMSFASSNERTVIEWSLPLE